MGARWAAASGSATRPGSGGFRTSGREQPGKKTVPLGRAALGWFRLVLGWSKTGRELGCDRIRSATPRNSNIDFPFFRISIFLQIQFKLSPNFQIKPRLNLVATICLTSGCYINLESSRAIHEDNNFGNDGEKSLNTKIFLLSTFLIFTIYWLTLIEGTSLLASKLPS